MKINCRWLSIERDTILGGQLGDLPRSDYGEHPEFEYYAVNALRLVIRGYNKSGDGPKMTQARYDELAVKYGPPRFR